MFCAKSRVKFSKKCNRVPFGILVKIFFCMYLLCCCAIIYMVNKIYSKGAPCATSLQEYPTPELPPPHSTSITLIAGRLWSVCEVCQSAAATNSNQVPVRILPACGRQSTGHDTTRPNVVECLTWTTRNSSRTEPRAGSGVVRIDPLRFLAGCRTRRLNQQ